MPRAFALLLPVVATAGVRRAEESWKKVCLLAPVSSYLLPGRWEAIGEWTMLTAWHRVQTEASSSEGKGSSMTSANGTYESTTIRGWTRRGVVEEPGEEGCVHAEKFSGSQHPGLRAVAVHRRGIPVAGAPHPTVLGLAPRSRCESRKLRMYVPYYAHLRFLPSSYQFREESDSGGRV